MKFENLRKLERTERIRLVEIIARTVGRQRITGTRVNVVLLNLLMTVGWISIMLLKDRKHSAELYSLLEIQCVIDVVGAYSNVQLDTECVVGRPICAVENEILCSNFLCILCSYFSKTL